MSSSPKTPDSLRPRRQKTAHTGSCTHLPLSPSSLATGVAQPRQHARLAASSISQSSPLSLCRFAAPLAVVVLGFVVMVSLSHSSLPSSPHLSLFFLAERLRVWTGPVLGVVVCVPRCGQHPARFTRARGLRGSPVLVASAAAFGQPAWPTQRGSPARLASGDSSPTRPPHPAVAWRNCAASPSARRRRTCVAYFT
jgi:hypothetical protein